MSYYNQGPPPPQGGYQQQSHSPYPQQGGYPPQQPYGQPPPMNQGGYPPQQPYGQPSMNQGGYPSQQPYGQPPPMNQGYPPQQGHSPYPPQGAPYGAPPPPGPGYGPPQGQNWGGPPAPPAAPSPGYIPGQQSQMDMTRAADELRAAMKGFGTDEKVLVRVLGSLGPLEINGVKAAFAAKHRRDLVKDVHSETSGHFRDGLEAILRGPLEQDCHELYESIKGLGTKESAMNDVLLARSNADLNAVKQHYHHKYRRTVEADVKGDLSAKTERMFDMVMAARRNEESAPIIPQQIDADVQEIYRATEGRAGTDQIVVCQILTSRSTGQVRAIATQYRQRYHRGLEEVIKNEFSGHMEQALCFIVTSAEDPAKHDADQLEDAMRGMGTNDAALIRRIVMIHWDPARLQQCKAAYRHYYKRELADRIRSETRGDYEKLMLACIGTPPAFGR